MTDPDVCVAAIDPGLTGAVAILFPAAPERVAVEDMPTANGEVDVASLSRILERYAPALAVVELVGPMPRDGVKQAFGFGGAYAAAKAAVTLRGIPLHLVTPVVWKRQAGLLRADDPKEAARALALRLFPASAEAFGRKRDHNRAEAALLARYAATIGR